MSELKYMTGFGNEFESEAIPGALPIGRFSPQKVNLGLYNEQFNSTAFTAPRAQNRRTWFYRIRPSALQSAYEPIDNGLMITADVPPKTTPERLRWSAFAVPEQAQDFVQGILTLATCGSIEEQTGFGIHIYLANRTMLNRYYINADAEMLIIPQMGGLRIHTECGIIEIEPGEIGVIPRGMKYTVALLQAQARGYLCENYGQPFTLPERGLVGANGYANDRDFQIPVAAYEDYDHECELITRFLGQNYRCYLQHSPLDVVAWTGNSVPYKYDLNRFNVINSVSYDHPDPSIFTVLSSPSWQEGVANVDFVIFPPRWLVSEDTFRPPWFHRNVMSEFMGLIRGVYDAKEQGFEPGGASLHNAFSPHGPEASVYEKATRSELKPQKYEDTLAFMLESRYVVKSSAFALQASELQSNYLSCWEGLNKSFTPPGSS